MKHQPQKPTITQENGPLGGHIETHPAFACVDITRWQGEKDRMFGSDLNHSHGVRLKISRATKRRTLSNDWIFADKKIIEVDITHDQWVRIISSSAGGATPVTLMWTESDGRIPGIAPPDVAGREQYRDELAESVRERLAVLDSLGDRINELLAAGKANKGDLAGLRKMLDSVNGIPGVASFVMHQFLEVAEKVATEVKTEVDAYVDQVARKLGLESIAQLPRMDAASADGLLNPPGGDSQNLNT